MKMFEKKILSVSVLSILLSGTASAEESAVHVGTVSVKGQSLGGGLMVQEDTPKARSVVTADALQKNPSAGNALDKISNVPGLQMSSTDSSGISGVAYTMRGMGADQIGLSADGVPLNDSGNYAVYPNLLGDSQNISQVFVTQGSSEADGPHIGSSGGNIGLSTKRPDKEAGLFVEQKFGSNSLRQSFARIETGKVGNFSAWLSASNTEADKWRGLGTLESTRIESSMFYQADNGNTSNLIIKYNKQNNNQYSNITKANYDAAENAAGTTGHRADYDDIRYKNALNPFENLNISFNQTLVLSDTITASIQPYYYWGNGGGSGGTSNLSRSSSRSGIYDLSNLARTTAFYRPSMTATWRPGVTAKVKWDINEAHSLSAGYWYERARQRQTQPYIRTNDGTINTGPTDRWADSNQFTDANGKIVQGRNQFTTTPAQRVWVQDTWFVSPQVTLSGGLAWESVKRQGENRGSLSAKAEQKEADYDELLPNFSAKYQINQNHQVFYNISRNMRTPPNFVLYNAGDSISLAPELSLNNELGWRYQTEKMLLSATLFNMSYKNRQISSQDLNNDTVMINAGKVDSRGLELEWGGNFAKNFNYYLSYSYVDTEQKDNILSRGVALPTQGKEVPNTSKNLVTASVGYDDSMWSWNFRGNYKSGFYGDMTNDEKVAGRTTFDFSAGVNLPVDKKYIKEAKLSFGVNNIFDKEYLDLARTIQTNSKTTGVATGSAPAYAIGEERTFVISLSAKM